MVTGAIHRPTTPHPPRGTPSMDPGWVVHHSHSSHSILIDAIRARDATRAEEWIARHLTKVSTELQQRITRHRPGLPA